MALPPPGTYNFLYLADKGKEAVSLGSKVLLIICAHMLLVGKSHRSTPKCKDKTPGTTVLVNIQEEDKMNLGTEVAQLHFHFSDVILNFFQFPEYSLLPLGLYLESFPCSPGSNPALWSQLVVTSSLDSHEILFLFDLVPYHNTHGSLF